MCWKSEYAKDAKKVSTQKEPKKWAHKRCIKSLYKKVQKSEYVKVAEKVGTQKLLKNLVLKRC